MSQSKKMKQAILANVVPNLTQAGFCGEYPHFRRVHADRIDIVSFAPYKYGNAFYVDTSTVFLRDKNNNLSNRFDGNYDKITTSDCIKIFRLKGNFGDKFFYTDVYFCLLTGAYYLGVSENNKSFKPRFLDIRVQKANPNIYEKVCDKVNRQMLKAYKWFDKMNRR